MSLIFGSCASTNTWNILELICCINLITFLLRRRAQDRVKDGSVPTEGANSNSNQGQSGPGSGQGTAVLGSSSNPGSNTSMPASKENSPPSTSAAGNTSEPAPVPAGVSET